jgi:hypothetical protein
MKNGFLPFGIGSGKDANTVITREMLEDFSVILKLIILEIFNQELPFKEKN